MDIRWKIHNNVRNLVLMPRGVKDAVVAIRFFYESLEGIKSKTESYEADDLYVNPNALSMVEFKGGTLNLKFKKDTTCAIGKPPEEPADKPLRIKCYKENIK